MWRIQKKEKFDIWENDLCSLKVQYEENREHPKVCVNLQTDVR